MEKEKRQIEIRLLPYSAGAFFSAMLESGLLIALSVLLERFINNISAGFEVAVFAGIIAVMAVRAAMVFFENFFYNRACLTVQHIIAVTLYKRALAHDELLKKVRSGDLTNMLNKDSDDLGYRVGQLKLNLAIGIIETVVLVTIIYCYSWIVGIAVTVFYPLYFVVCGIINRQIEKKMYALSRSGANLSQGRLKGIQGWLELAVMKKRNYYLKKYDDLYKTFTKKYISWQKFYSLNAAVRMVSDYLLPVLCIIIGTLPVLSGASVTSGVLFSVYLLAGYLNQPLHTMTEAIKMLSENKAIYRRLSDIIYFNPKAYDGGADTGEIENIDIDVSDYSYDGQEKLLQNCRIDVRCGDLVAVRGDSGCGKSTLFKLLIKQNEYTGLHGSIQYNGIPVQSLSRSKLYDKLQYVSQNYFVFEDTLYNNLCLGDQFTESQVNEVIDMCCLRSFVDEYGMDMVIEEGGKNISQGQLQRICIARALLRSPQCLLLDEPTSALDEGTGDALMKNMVDYTKSRGIITFVISHKNEVIDRADKGVILKKGEDCLNFVA